MHQLSMTTPDYKSIADALASALEELKAVVWGECPSLLNEDSGGDSELDIEIDAALAAYRAAVEEQKQLITQREANDLDCNDAKLKFEADLEIGGWKK